MRLYFCCLFLFICLLKVQAQEDITKGVVSFLKDYEAVLNNISDPALSLNERKLFREDILDIYYIRGETKVFNHLNSEGSRFLTGKEYLDNLLLNTDERIKHEVKVGDDMEFNVRASTFSVPVEHSIQTESNTQSARLLYIIKWYNDSRPDIVSVIEGEDGWQEKVDSEAFAAAEKNNTIRSYEEYVNTFPEGKYRDKAQFKIDSLKEEQEWKKAENIADLTAYETYISLYPEGRYLDEARVKIEALRERERFKQLPETIQSLLKTMVEVDGGKVEMGCRNREDLCFSDEKVRQEILGDFSISPFEVTQSQWVAVMGENIEKATNCAACPVTDVSWQEVQQYIQKLNQMTGERFRLPTEAEWEYAAKGGQDARSFVYAGSNNPLAVALHAANSASELSPFQQQANSLGLYNMSGSVYEWCQDDYTEIESSSDNLKVIKGGAWNTAARYCRISQRFWMAAKDKMDNIGFRLVKE